VTDKEETPKLTKPDWEEIILALEYTTRAYENYSMYPGYQFKQDRVAGVKDLIRRCRAIRQVAP